MSVEPSSFDVVSTSQVRLKDAYFGGLMELQRKRPRRIKKKKIQKTPTILRLRLGATKENLLPKKVKLGSKLLHTEPVHQLTRKVKKATEATCDHYLHISPNTSHSMEAVFSMVRKIYGRQFGDLLKDSNVILTIW